MDVASVTRGKADARLDARPTSDQPVNPNDFLGGRGICWALRFAVALRLAAALCFAAAFRFAAAALCFATAALCFAAALRLATAALCFAAALRLAAALRFATALFLGSPTGWGDVTGVGPTTGPGGVPTGVVAVVEQGVLVITLSSSVTAPLRASALPFRLAVVFSEIDVSAMMFPTNALPVPIVAELPTCQ